MKGRVILRIPLSFFSALELLQPAETSELITCINDGIGEYLQERKGYSIGNYLTKEDKDGNYLGALEALFAIFMDEIIEGLEEDLKKEEVKK